MKVNFKKLRLVVGIIIAIGIAILFGFGEKLLSIILIGSIIAIACGIKIGLERLSAKRIKK